MFDPVKKPWRLEEFAKWVISCGDGQGVPGRVAVESARWAMGQPYNRNLLASALRKLGDEGGD